METDGYKFGDVMKTNLSKLTEHAFNSCLEERIGIIIMPFYENGDLLLVAYNTQLTKEWNLEFPFGENMFGENLLESANRIFIQSTGMYAIKVEEFATLYPNFGIYDIVYIFTAEDLKELPLDHMKNIERVTIKVTPSKLASLIKEKVFMQEFGILAFKKFYYSTFK